MPRPCASASSASVLSAASRFVTTASTDDDREVEKLAVLDLDAERSDFFER